MEVSDARKLQQDLALAITRLVRDFEESTGAEVTGLDRLTSYTMDGERPYRRTAAINVSVAL